MKRQLICLAGLPGVGKSTVAEKLASRLQHDKSGAEVVDMDVFKRMYVDQTKVVNEVDPPEVRWNYYTKSLELVFRMFRQENPTIRFVILDEVFHLRELRTRLESQCAGEGVSVHWVEVRCAFEVVKYRLYTNARQGHVLSADQALKMNTLFKEIFEPFLPSDHNHVIAENGKFGAYDIVVNEILTKLFPQEPK